MAKFYFIVISLLLLSCVDTNLRQTSMNIDDAKKKGVFQQEYRPLKNPIIENDSIKMIVSSAWIETGFYYDDKYGKTIRPNSDLYLRIKLKDTISDYYGIKWQIGLSFEEYIRSAGYVDLISDLKKYKNGDTLLYYVRKGSVTLRDQKFDTSQKIIFVPAGKAAQTNL